VLVAVQIAGNAGVPPDKAGLAGALITASFQVGVALGLAILSALATARTNSLLSAHHAVPDALVGGYTRALLGAAFFVGAVMLIGLRAANTKGEPPGGTRSESTGIASPGEMHGTACQRLRHTDSCPAPGGPRRGEAGGIFLRGSPQCLRGREHHHLPPQLASTDAPAPDEHCNRTSGASARSDLR
jgi:hypothetical protein